MSNRSTEQEFDPTDEKRKLFWLLKRLTSYALWRRKHEAWGAFVSAYEHAIKSWSSSEQAHLDVDLLPLAYNALARYNDGLSNLARGYRFVWRIGQSLFDAQHICGTVFANFYRHPDYWERGMQLQRYPENIERLQELMLSARFHGDRSPLEIRSDAAYLAAHWSRPSDLLDPASYNYGFYSMAYPVFPRVLPDVPEAQNIVISTGDEVPVDGIWEPVAASRERLLGLIPVGQDKYHGSGCFNYFVNGTSAPRIQSYNETTRRVDAVTTSWRLLWADDRYTDGLVSDESEYFLVAERISENDTTPDPGELMTGSICPVSGLWEPIGYKNPPAHLAAGTVMPNLSVRDVKGDMIAHYVKWRLVKRD